MKKEKKDRHKKRYQVCLQLDYDNDVDVIYVLDNVEKKQTFIKELIRDKARQDRRYAVPF